MRVNREEFLKQLESVLPGLSAREIIEQSSCFIFKGKRVMTYNDEVACSQKSCIDIEGAVLALPLVSILRKLQEEEIEVALSEGELLIRGKRRKSGIRMETEILLPIETVETPKKWKDLPEDFADAVSIVQECAGKNESQFTMTCVHLCSGWIEACDNYQAARYKIEMSVKQSTLVRRESLKYVVSLDMTKFSETETWIHFKNPTGLILSCRRFVEEGSDLEYPNLASVLEMKDAEPIVLPKGLKEATERAEIFSAENADDNQVRIQLRRDKLKITGRGSSGWFSEIKKIKYNGQPLSFTISPKLLAELVQRHNKCEITPNRLKVDVGKFQYITVLGAVKKVDV